MDTIFHYLSVAERVHRALTLVRSMTPEFNKASTVKHHYCTQLAEQVVGGDVELDRYMNTDCRLTILAEAEGLRL